ncbi:MAG: hypothetical protein R2814_11420 [Flavobacteriaceae bacterium]
MNKKETISWQKRGSIILEYALWTMAALLLGMGYMYFILGSIPEATNAWNFFLGQIYLFALIRIGLLIGGIVALLFILFDVLYLKRKPIATMNSFLIRVISMLLITGIVGVIHYILEKYLDVI